MAYSSDEDEEYARFLNRFFSKKMRTYEEEEEEEEAKEDRISGLSDSILHKIMSFLNTKYAAQTCVLSKRWQFVWKSLPYLDFNYETFPFQGDLEERHYGPQIRSFNNFITQVVFRRCPTDLIKVSFRSYTYEREGSIVESLICYAVEHNVQELIIRPCSECSYILPESFYSCKSLTSLQLVADWVYDDHFKLSKFLSLPALKYLHLDGFSMSESNFHPAFFCGCPNLETLKLYKILIGECRKLCFSALKLKNLELSFCQNLEDFEKGRCKIVIVAPSLTSFKYEGYATTLCSTDNFANLDDVYLNIYTHNFEVADKKEEYALQFIKNVKDFHRAKSLTLTWTTVEVLAMFPSLLDENRFPFSNLKYLKIYVSKWHWKNLEIPGCLLSFFLNSFTKFRICTEGMDRK